MYRDNFGRIAVVGVLVFLCVAVPLRTVTAQQTQPADSSQKTEFEGTWLIVSIDADGERLSYLANANNKMVFRGRLIISKSQAFETASATIENVDASKRPKTLDMLPANEEDKTKIMLGIYRLDGDSLKICLAPAGKPRPTVFESNAGTGHVLQILKREGL